MSYGYLLLVVGSRVLETPVPTRLRGRGLSCPERQTGSVRNVPEQPLRSEPSHGRQGADAAQNTHFRVRHFDGVSEVCRCVVRIRWHNRKNLDLR